MGDYWRSFASQNYFDPHGLFLSVLWSGPLLIIATIILVGVCSYPFNLLLFSFFLLFILTLLSYLQINSLFSLCYMIVRWKRAELRHRARLARESNKQDWSSLACWSVRKIEEPLLPFEAVLQLQVILRICIFPLSYKVIFFFSYSVSNGVKYNLGSITLPCTPVHFTVSGFNLLTNLNSYSFECFAAIHKSFWVLNFLFLDFEVFGLFHQWELWTHKIECQCPKHSSWMDVHVNCF
jgi:hypothetical protein